MKAISLWQPWAWAIFHGKPVENRDWPTRYRGPLLIHAAKKMVWEDQKWIERTFPGLIPPGQTFPIGALIGKVTLLDCVMEYDSPWFFGPYGHVYYDPMEFKTPISYRGMQGLFDVPDSVIKEALL